MKKLLLTSFVVTFAVGCASNSKPVELSAEQYDQVAKAVAAEQGTVTAAEAGTFDCDMLYKNYDVAMENNAPKKKKKKFGLGSIAKIAGSGIGSSVALMTGADLGTLKTVVDAEQAVNAVNTVTTVNESMDTLTSATKVIDINRSAYKLAMQNGCEVSKLDKITKKYGEQN